MAKKSAKGTKAASLTGALLVRNKRDDKSGFVLKPEESPEVAVEASPKPAAYSPTAPSNERSPYAAQDAVAPEIGPNASSNPEENAGTGRTAVPSPQTSQLGSWSKPVPQTGGPQALVQALRAGHLERAESLFGSMSGLKPEKLKEVLYGDSGRSLALACRALGFDQLQFASTLILSRKLGLEEAEGDPAVFSSASQLFQETEPQEALEMLQAWCRD